jgi:hypothetical protein
VLELPMEAWLQVDAYADRHSIPVPDALRYLLQAGLDAEHRAMLRGP